MAACDAKKRKPSQDFPAQSIVPMGKYSSAAVESRVQIRLNDTIAKRVPPMNDPFHILHPRALPTRDSILSMSSISSMVSLEDHVPIGERANIDALALDTTDHATLSVPKNERPCQPSKEREYFERIWAQNFERSEAMVSSDASTILPIGVPARLNRIQGFSFARDSLTHRLYAVYRLEIENIVEEKQWTIYRRFDDFKQLCNQLKSQVGHFPSLPTRTWKRSLDTSFLRKRQLVLDRWLREVLMLISLENCNVDRAQYEDCQCGKDHLHVSARIARQFLTRAANQPPNFGTDAQSYQLDSALCSTQVTAELSSDRKLTRGNSFFLFPSKSSFSLTRKASDVSISTSTRRASADKITLQTSTDALSKRLQRASIADAGQRSEHDSAQSMSSLIRRSILVQDVGEDVAVEDATFNGQMEMDESKISRHHTLRDFDVLRMIGRGSFGKVLLIRMKQTLELYAVKIIDKSLVVRKQQVEHTKTERRVLASITHPFIVCLHYAFQTKDKLFFVLDYCPGGDLFFHLSRSGCFPEYVAKFFTAEIVLALIHLHQEGIVYRDLKPENIMLDVDGHVKLADFGLAKEGIHSHTNGTYTMCGTPEYLPPEILNRDGHGTAVDWWNLGMVLYELLTGRPPWYTQDREELFHRLREATLEFPDGLSPEAMDLIQGLLQRNPSERLGASDPRSVTYHPFFADIDWNALYHRQVMPPYRPCLYTDPIDAANFEEEFTKLPPTQIDAHGLTIAPDVYHSSATSQTMNGAYGNIPFPSGNLLSSSINHRNSDVRNVSYTFAGFTYERRSMAFSGVQG